jgi:hypothetical protein
MAHAGNEVSNEERPAAAAKKARWPEVKFTLWQVDFGITNPA